MNESPTTSADSDNSGYRHIIKPCSGHSDKKVSAYSNYHDQNQGHQEVVSTSFCVFEPSRSECQDETSEFRSPMLQKPLPEYVVPSALITRGFTEHDPGSVSASLSNTPRPSSFHSTRPDSTQLVALSSNTSSSFAIHSRGPYEASEVDPDDDMARISRRSTSDSHMSEGVHIHDWASESSFISERDSESVFTYASSIPSIYPPHTNGTAANGGRLLPCEFSRYALCTEWFHAEDTHTWVEHVITDHLHNKVPSKCCCWFCDDFKFDVAKTGVDQYTNFTWRMDHIREHLIGDGYTIARSRPDFDFLDHLWNEKLISQSTFDEARNWQDGPPSRVKGLYAYDFEPAESLRMREQSNWIPVDQKREDRDRMRSRSSHHETPQGKIRTQSQKSSRATNARSASRYNHGSGRCQDNSSQMIPSRSDRLRKSSESRKEFLEPSGSMNGLGTRREHQKSPQELEHKLGVLVISEKHIMEENSEAKEVDNTATFQIDVDKPMANNPKSPEATHRVRKKQSVVIIDERNSTELSQRIHLAAQKLVGSLPLRKLAPSCSVREHTNVSNGQSSSNASSSRGGSESSQLGPRARQSIQPEKKKRKFSREPNDEDSDEEQTQCRSSKGKDKEGQSLACPFYKHDRLRYGDRRYCNGPGWPDMHRLK